MHVKQWLMIGTLTGGALLAGAWLGPAAQAGSGGGGAQINGTTIWTSISYSEPGAQSGFKQLAASGWTPPACWLEPWPGGFGVSPGYTPDEFASFMTMLDGFAGTQGTPGNPDGGADQWDALYKDGQGDDPIVHMIQAPYNQGVSGGKWYGIACSTDSSYSDLAAFVKSLNLTNSYEDWFWITNGKPPKGVATVDLNILAEYAASKAAVPQTWPNADPAFNVKQTVGLPTELSSSAVYRQYVVTATLADLGLSTQVTATPASITISAKSGVLKTNPVTCKFSGDALPGCDLNFIQASNGAKFTLAGTVTWNVVWGGAPGEAGWTKKMTVPLANQQVTVQEIQTIVNGGN